MTSEQASRMIRELSAAPPASYADLKVLILNCTLNRTPVLSHTEGVIAIAEEVFASVGASCESLRPVDSGDPDAGRWGGTQSTREKRP